MGGDTAETAGTEGGTAAAAAGAEGDTGAVDPAGADAAGTIRLLLTLGEQPV